MTSLFLKLLALSITLPCALAGELIIKSTNDKPINLKIFAGGGTGGQKVDNLPGHLEKVPPHGTVKIDTTKLGLGEVKTFTIEGETHPFTGDQCKNLNVDEDYFIEFTNDWVGTTCMAQKR